MEKSQAILGSIVVVSFLVITVFLGLVKAGTVQIDPWMKDALQLVIGAWIAQFTTVVQYIFGSSKGSNDKNKMLTRKE